MEHKWEVYYIADCPGIRSKDGVIINAGTFSGLQTPKHAELIVRACNAHKSLVEVCKLLQDYYDGRDGPQYNLID